jgi:hypothetical protein
VKEIKASGGQAVGISTDVSSVASVKSAFSEIQKEFKDKKLAAAIFNVGGKFVRKPFLEMTQEEYEAGFEANGYTALFFSALSLPIPRINRGLIYTNAIIEGDSISLRKQHFHSSWILSRPLPTLLL